MCAEDRDGVRRHFRKLFHETGAPRLQRIDDPFVVHDFVPHVDRRSIFIERALDNLNRTYDAGAEAARLRQYNFHHAPPFVRLLAACRRRRARSCRIAISDGCNSGACFAPKTSNTFATIPFVSRPAFAYMAGGESWSMNTSGRIMLRTLKFVRSSAPDSAKYCMTCAPKPPIAPSSTVTSSSCSRARRRTRSVSSGLAKRASATVVDMP